MDLRAAGGVPVRASTLPPLTISATGASERPWRFVILWALSWAVVGLAVGLVIVLVQASQSPTAERSLFGSITQMSILFAEVVGLTALSSSRLIFPYYAGLPYLPRLLLQIATVGGGALFGTVVVVSMFPLFTIHNIRLILLMVLVNACLALVVGIAVHTYESMKRQLEKSFEELREKEAFQREMEIAREVQEQLFPKTVPRVRGLEIAGICLPAAGVGGDYYDYVPISDERVGLVVADVSGKGISAALVMASLQASVRNVIGSDCSPLDANHQLNQILYRSTTSSRYATLFLGMFDGRDRSLCYSNAGHNPPVILRASGAQKLSEGGLPLGIMENSLYAQGDRTLETGDLLLLYTDGAVEAADPQGQEFGLERLVGFVQERRHADDLGSLIQETIAELREWTQESLQQDDITLVVARATDAH